MTTKQQIAEEAGRRLGDTSPEFLPDLLSAFDWMMKDLAGEGAIGEVVRKTSRVFMVTGQIEYDTRQAVLNVATGTYPTILELRVRAWGADMDLTRAESHFAFEQFRASYQVESNARPKIWQLWPNRRTLQIFPPPDATSASASAEFLYSVPPSSLLPADEITEVEAIDEETLVVGVMARTAQFTDETFPDLQIALAQYAEGKQRMVSRAKGSMRIGQLAQGSY